MTLSLPALLILANENVEGYARMKDETRVVVGLGLPYLGVDAFAGGSCADGEGSVCRIGELQELPCGCV